MGNYNNNEDYTGHNMGSGGFGGSWLLGGLIIIILIFKDGFSGHRGGHGEGHGGDRGRERGWFPDESNWQLQNNLQNQFCALTAQVERKGDETNNLITQTTIQNLRDEKADLKAENQTLKSEAFTSAYFSSLEARIEALACRMPHLEPQYIATRGMCLSERPSCGEPRRGGCFE